MTCPRPLSPPPPPASSPRKRPWPLAKMQPPSKAKTFPLLKTPASSPKNLGFDAGAHANPDGTPAPSTATQKHLL
eukprot:2498517-Alexandrium_andersonii.AAC.1